MLLNKFLKKQTVFSNKTKASFDNFIDFPTAVATYNEIIEHQCCATKEIAKKNVQFFSI